MKDNPLKSISIKISPGNKKTGKIPAISLPPIKACAKNIPCAKDCYAIKSFRMYPNVREAWTHNWKVFQKNRDLYFRDVSTYLSIKVPPHFRWHVSGDIQDQDYLERMKKIARKHLKIKFLAFTKRIDLVFRNLPDNLSIIASMWPGWGDPKSIKLPKAWMQDGSENRISKKSWECIGSCDQCHVCWNLGRDSSYNDVILIKH